MTMLFKIILYIFFVPFTIWAMDSININSLFKKNKELQAQVFYLIVVLSLSYLVVNFFYDFFINMSLI